MSLEALLGKLTSQSALHYLQSVAFPDKYQSAPPNLYQRANYIQTITVSGTFIVTDDAHNPDVSSQQGMVQWLTMRGLISVLRYGFLPSGWSFSQTDPQSGFRGWLPVTDALTPGPYITQGLGTVTMSSECAIPYGARRNVADTITIDPNPAQYFSSGRLVAGVLELRSTTTSTTLAALTGVGSYGILSDSRDAAQLVGQKAYDPATLKSKSITDKDGAVNFDLYKGAVSLVGPDIQDNMRAPDADLTNPHYDELTTIQIPGGSTAVTQIVPANANITGIAVAMCNRWFSPVGASLSNTQFALGPGGTYNVALPTIDECGTLDFNMSTWAALSITMPPVVCCNFELIIREQSIYVQCKEGDVAQPWNTYFNSTAQTRAVHNFTTGGGSGVSANEVNISASFNPSHDYHAQGGTKGLGKLFGILVTYYIKVTSLNQSIGAFNITASLNLTNESYGFAATTVGVPGWVGPMHAIEWRSVTAAGQQLTLGGTLVCQVIPNASISTFTKDAVAKTNRAIDVNTIPMVASIFDSGDTYMRRNWIGEDYKFFREQNEGKMDATKVVQLTNSNPHVLATLGAAGLFSNIGNALGTMAGSFIPGLGGIGSALGSAFGGSLDSSLGTGYGAQGQYGASGQWGGSGAAGQWSAAGSDPAADAAMARMGPSRRLRSLYE